MLVRLGDYIFNTQDVVVIKIKDYNEEANIFQLTVTTRNGSYDISGVTDKQLRQLLSENEEINKIQVTWRTLSYPEMKRRLKELCGHDDMSFNEMVSALYWKYIETVKEEKIR